jgi:hypothetical protein
MSDNNAEAVGAAEDTEEICGICGDLLVGQCCETLLCTHVFHYECIFRTFKMMKKGGYLHSNRCPYCRKKTKHLTIVNGLNKLEPKIHYNPKGDMPPYESTRCSHILTRGANKGKECGKKCQVGYDVCKAHKK